MDIHCDHAACNDCAFLENQGTEREHTDDGGLCRFNPPVTQPDANERGLWPVVAANDWCGHFAPEHRQQ
ncbi:hypothetical protein [Aliirhizobium cellulosilyticum]|uniref:Uncharacterized protein n=1 Tax=Aliirhizobium cellulosilyticum TaxID=393664 RepID=A0A7W6TKD0_9HYPH|nr:hypothetical protein [Rhizobium cellulosilyticum]MBB4351764.1 hypothetical protein [Rhizobium cellulosilyticum]MBB4414930.1 hypothetical protein [Rhizobium cellulosilyticum]MBB4449691.1 hypothetical protein [Rhizobium cellulosilyticum]